LRLELHLALLDHKEDSHALPKLDPCGCAGRSAADTIGGAPALDDTKYPNLKGQWDRFVVPGVRSQPSFDQTKSLGHGQQAPLSPEY
jgi:hypothetical protein